MGMRARHKAAVGESAGAVVKGEPRLIQRGGCASCPTNCTDRSAAGTRPGFSEFSAKIRHRRRAFFLKVYS